MFSPFAWKLTILQTVKICFGRLFIFLLGLFTDYFSKRGYILLQNQILRGQLHVKNHPLLLFNKSRHLLLRCRLTVRDYSCRKEWRQNFVQTLIFEESSSQEPVFYSLKKRKRRNYISRLRISAENNLPKTQAANANYRQPILLLANILNTFL